MWKEMSMACSEALFWNLPAGFEETMKNLSQSNWYPSLCTGN
jgi:hypothetical protein